MLKKSLAASDRIHRKLLANNDGKGVRLRKKSECVQSGGLSTCNFACEVRDSPTQCSQPWTRGEAPCNERQLENFLRRLRIETR
jgi:hypothetical protein